MNMKMRLMVMTVAAALVFLSFASFFVSDGFGQHAVNLYFFYGKGCPHCADEAKFLAVLKQKYPSLEIKAFEVWYNAGNAKLLVALSQQYGTKPKGVPMTFIGTFDPIAGYSKDEITGKLIEEKVKYCFEQGCEDPIEPIVSVLAPDTAKPSYRQFGTAESPPAQVQKPKQPKAAQQPDKQPSGAQQPPEKIEDQPRPAEKTVTSDTVVSIPLVGDTDVSRMTLPVLTVILAGLDSFNPCAFFVLFTLLGILVHARSRTRMMIIGGTFVFFSGFIYFLFMSAWLNIFMHIGELMVITLIAGIVALVIAGINIKDFFFFKQGVSLTIPESAKPKLFERMRHLLKATSLPSMIFGTVVLSIAANTYELLCTVGFPLVFTRVLTLNNLPMLRYYLYLVLYNVVYVIPLAAIVLMFVWTLGTRKLTEWQGQVLKLISGLMMLFLGIVLLVDPSLFNNILVGIGLLAAALVGAGIVILVTKKFRRGESEGMQ
ncbi:MAG: hypothetical protein ACM34I_02250 [bacterium]